MQCRDFARLRQADGNFTTTSLKRDVKKDYAKYAEEKHGPTNENTIVMQKQSKSHIKTITMKIKGRYRLHHLMINIQCLLMKTRS